MQRAKVQRKNQWLGKPLIYPRAWAPRAGMYMVQDSESGPGPAGPIMVLARCRHPLLVLLLCLPTTAGISVEGIKQRGYERHLSEYWVENHQLFTNAFQLDSDDDGIQEDSDSDIVLKGVNWYGFESKDCTYGGSWADTSLAAIIDAIRRHGFNAIRIPLALSGCPLRADEELEEFVRTAGDHGCASATPSNCDAPSRRPHAHVSAAYPVGSASAADL